MTAVIGIITGSGFGLFMHYQLRAWYGSINEAVAGLDESERSQVVNAITHGPVPADPSLRLAAMKLGSAYLGGRSADQLKRRDRQTWILYVFLVGFSIAEAVLAPSPYVSIYFVALGLLLVVTLPVSLRRGRRLRHNIARLAED
jgi:hypothetical protein